MDMIRRSAGIRENGPQFTMLVLINLFVGAMVGLERTVLPLLGEQQFGLVSASAAVSFIISFGFSKAVLNLFAGRFADRFGRRNVLLAGWGVGALVPLTIILATHWWIVIFANILLGVNQALTWSMTVNMKLDIVKEKQRGLAVGLNEAAGYIGLSMAAVLSGYIAARFGLRPEPFYLGFAFAVIGFLLALFVKETSPAKSRGRKPAAALSSKEIFLRTTWEDRTLSRISFAGMATNLKDGMAWGLFPIFFVQQDLSVNATAVLVSAYPVAWGASQLITGYISDRVGRRILIVSGMLLQACSLWWVIFTNQYTMWLIGAMLLGVGTAMVYPTLQAAVGDASDPTWRATSLGVYRFWRDSGYAFGALFAGVLADAINVTWAIGIVASVPFLAGLLFMNSRAEVVKGY